MFRCLGQHYPSVEVEAVVPPLDVVVRPNGQHVDGPAGRRPHCAGNPGVSYVLD